MTKPDFIVFGAPQIEQSEIDEVVACLESGWIGTGPRVAQFESEFSSYKGVASAAAVSSCTAAMHLSVLAAGIGEGDEVITTPLTFCATVNAIIHAGATPVLADVDSRTMNIDPGAIEAKITAETKALLPVHFAGRPCDMDAILDIAKRHDLQVIEDCAHAIETEYHGRKAGTFGDFGCFSFYATKNVSTGEGGMVLTRREEDLGANQNAGAPWDEQRCLEAFQRRGLQALLRCRDRVQIQHDGFAGGARYSSAPTS